MKNLVWIFAALILLSGCAPTRSQLVTLSSTNLNTTAKREFIQENDTLRLTYQFFSERGVVQFTIENKLNKPLYIDWKRSAFIVGKNKVDYWRDEAEVNLEGRANTLSIIPVWNRTWLRIGGVIRKANPIDYIPPGTAIECDQFAVAPANALQLPGQFVLKKVESAIPDRKKPVEVQEYQYTVDTSPVAFRNYLTFSTDKNFATEFVLDNKFWASSVQVMPHKQLTGGNDWTGLMGTTIFRTSPYYRPNAFFVNFTPVSE